MSDKDDFRFYRGRSMSGTFLPGDCLIVESTSLVDIHIGDVIVYRGTNHHGEEDALVHRIVAVTPDGLVARGDNNPCPDTALVTSDNLIGRVTHVERDGKTRPVLGGWMDLWRAGILCAQRRVWRYGWWLAARIGRGSYRQLRESGIIARLWQPRFVKLRLNTEKGALVKYICHGRTVARWWVQGNRFECAKPYDLVIFPPDKPAVAESRQSNPSSLSFPN